jgi:Reverse transcriptase (RNA-dependent DNA polymerase)
MQDGLKITSKSGTILYDSSWIAGVDYESSDVDNENEDDHIEEENHEINYNYDEVNPNELAEIIDEVPIKTNNPIGNNYENIENDEASIEANNDEENIEENNEQNIIDNEEIEANINNDDVQGDFDNINEDYDENLYDYDVTTTEQTTKSGRVSKAPNRFGFQQHNLLTQGHQTTEYSIETAKVIAKTMCYCNNMINNKNHSFLETYSLKKGLKHFGAKGYDAAFGEIKQLHDRVAFKPIHIKDLTQQEKKRAMESLIFLVEKRDGRVKARACANGSTQRDYINKEDAASPTAAVESILLTATIDAKENRDIMSVDIPNAFIQTNIESKDNEKMTMKIRGPLVDMLLELEHELYSPFVVHEYGEKVIYVFLVKALYGTLISALLFYKKLKNDLESIGFKINPYDPCVANRVINNKQHTVTWHVDDLKSSHVDPKVNDEFLKWLNAKYGDPKVAPVKATRGQIHDYLAMKLDFTKRGKLIVDMSDYVKSMVKEFPEELCKSNYPWNENLFKVDTNSPELAKDKRELFHTFVAKGLFVCKRARPDIQPAIAFLTTRVKAPNEQDWFKLVKMMNYLNSTQDDVLTLNTDDTFNIIWHLDAAFAVHNDKKSHTGATMSLGDGAIISVSTKQKVNTRSSTEAELVSIDDIISKVLWTKLFLQEQGWKVNQNIMMRDNLSSMKLETNGKLSSGKRTRHFDIKYFYITDLIERNEVTIQYCPTDSMIADYMTKPLLGAKFQRFRKDIMNNG